MYRSRYGSSGDDKKMEFKKMSKDLEKQIIKFWPVLFPLAIILGIYFYIGAKLFNIANWLFNKAIKA